MKVPFSWLKEFVEIDVTPQELQEKLFGCGFEVEELIDLSKKGGVDKKTLETYVLLLAPFAPHIAEELWSELGHDTSVFAERWPEYDKDAMEDDEVEIAVQINGKTKGVVSIAKDASKEDALAAGKAAIADKLTGNVIKEIYVPGKIINIVMK